MNTNKQALREKIIDLIWQGYTYKKIAKALNLTVYALDKLLKQIKLDYNKEMIKYRKEVYKYYKENGLKKTASKYKLKPSKVSSIVKGLRSLSYRDDDSKYFNWRWALAGWIGYDDECKYIVYKRGLLKRNLDDV